MTIGNNSDQDKRGSRRKGTGEVAQKKPNVLQRLHCVGTLIPQRERQTSSGFRLWVSWPPKHGFPPLAAGEAGSSWSFTTHPDESFSCAENLRSLEGRDKLAQPPAAALRYCYRLM